MSARALLVMALMLGACGTEREPARQAPRGSAAPAPTKHATIDEALTAVRATATVPAGYQGRIKSAGFVGFIPDDERPAIYVSRIASDGVRTLEDFIARGGLGAATVAHEERWETGWLIVAQPTVGGEPLVMSYSAAGGDEVFLCQSERDAPVVRSVCKSLRPAR